MIVDKNALSARSGEPRRDADASPTSPPAKSARSSEAGSDGDEGVEDAQVRAAQPPEDGSWATVARRRSPTAAAPAPALEQRGGKGSALVPAAAGAKERLQTEIGRRAVQISQEIFEAAGVPVPQGYVKVGTGGLRRVFKERAR